MSTEPTAGTVVLIHGFWVTPRSWEHWIARYESRGYRVLAPAYPGFEVEVEALNADPSPIEGAHRAGDRRRWSASSTRRPSWDIRRAAPSCSSCSTAATEAPGSDQLSAHRGRGRGTAVPGQGGLPRPKDDTYLDYHNDDRAPLLEHDHRGQGVRGTGAPAPAQDGWEEVADYALEWAEGHAVSR